MQGRRAARGLRCQEDVAVHRHADDGGQPRGRQVEDPGAKVQPRDDRMARRGDGGHPPGDPRERVRAQGRQAQQRMPQRQLAGRIGPDALPHRHGPRQKVHHGTRPIIRHSRRLQG